MHPYANCQVEKATANDKVAKEEAKDRKHAKEAEAEAIRHEKQLDNKAETHNLRSEVDQQHHAGTTGPTGTHLGYTGAGGPVV